MKFKKNNKKQKTNWHITLCLKRVKINIEENGNNVLVKAAKL
jgi:hypothetical protein